MFLKLTSLRISFTLFNLYNRVVSSGWVCHLTSRKQILTNFKIAGKCCMAGFKLSPPLEKI